MLKKEKRENMKRQKQKQKGQKNYDNSDTSEDNGYKGVFVQIKETKKKDIENSTQFLNV